MRKYDIGGARSQCICDLCPVNGDEGASVDLVNALLEPQVDGLRRSRRMSDQLVDV